MKKIRNLRELDQRIRLLEEVEKKDKEIIKDGVSKTRRTTEYIDLAFYVGRLASVIFRNWNKPSEEKSTKWKGLLINILIIAGIHLAQQFLERSKNK